MKNLSNFKSFLLRAAVVLTTCSLAVSCYDDSDVWNEFTRIEEQMGTVFDRIYAIEDRLNSELGALSAMLNGKLVISDVSRNVATGVVTVTLSNGSVLELLPETDLSSTVTYLTIGGVDYWAYIDADGRKQLFKNEKGEGIPVVSSVPEVIVKDGDYYIVLAGMEYPLGGNSVFSGYEVITDPVSGDITAVTFTFGEDMNFTVTVDGACCFHFVMSSGWGSYSVIDNFYVANGLSSSVKVEMMGVEDYILQVPEGWKVKERSDIYTGEKFFDVTAPSFEKVSSQDAEAEGELKVVAVLQGGKATTAKLYLTTSPFKQFDVSFGKADVEIYNGIEKYFYGVCAADQYDEALIFSTVNELLEAYDYPAGYGMAEGDLSEASVVEILGSDPVYGDEYVFWAVPLQYYSSEEDSYYYVLENTFTKEGFRFTDVSFEITDEAFRDADLKMELKGVASYYAGLVPAADFMIEDVVYELSRGSVTPKTEPLSYDGSVFEFVDVEAESNTAYVAWFAEAHEGEYSEADVIVREFSTLNLVPGGNVNVQAGEAVQAALEIEVPLTAEGAETIYYAYLTTADAKKYEDDAAKAVYLFENGLSVAAVSATARLSDFPKVKAKLNTTYAFWAVASDADGQYGNLLSAEYTTTDIPFNDIEVLIDVPVNSPDGVQITVSAEGAVEYLYWLGKTSDNTWKSPNYLGGEASKAEVYMFTNPTASRLLTAMETYPLKDGRISATDLEPDVEYGIVVMAKGADGTYSHATALKFTVRPVNIGKVVLSSDPKWAEVKPVVEFIPESFSPATGMMSGNYAVNVTIPLGYTGYVLLGSDTYLNEGNTEVKLSVEDKIISVMQQADASRTFCILVDDDAWVNDGYPHGYEFYCYKHGSPSLGSRPGSAVIWASEEFHASRCDCLVDPPTTVVMSNVEMPIEYVVLFNDGNPVRFFQCDAIGSTTEVIDRVFVVLQDTEGNCYELYEYDVPVEYFQNAGK